MPFGRAHPKAGCEALQELHRQGNFGQHDQNLPALAQSFGDGLEIDFGLSRTRYAVQQAGGEFFRRHRAAQMRRRLGLVAVQLRLGESWIGRWEGRELRQLGCHQCARRDQSPHHGGRHIGVFRQARHAARQPILRHGQHAFAPFRQFGGDHIALHIGGTQVFRLKGAPRPQRHGQNRARRVDGVIRHPVNEIAQTGGQNGRAVQRNGHFQAVVAHYAFSLAPHHAQAFAVPQRGGNHRPPRCVYAPRKLVIIGAGQRQRQQNARPFLGRQNDSFLLQPGGSHGIPFAPPQRSRQPKGRQAP